MYLSWDKKNIIDFSDQNVNRLYAKGYVFTRLAKGEMNRTRALRIDLSEFVPSSENRRVLKKTAQLSLIAKSVPLTDYSWKIAKMAKDFYQSKFGKGTFSANKAREILTRDHNFNMLLEYRLDDKIVGYCISVETDKIIHYCYPFYRTDLSGEIKNLGMGMMLKAIIHAMDKHKKYFYLGSAQRPGDKYKLQFKGLEWFDGEKWRENTGDLKDILTE